VTARAPEPSDKRRHARLRLVPPAIVRLELDGMPGVDRVLLVDLSESGCAVLLPKETPRPDGPRVAGRLHLLLPGPPPEKIDLAVRARSVVPHALGGLRIGFEFLELDTKEVAELQEKVRAYMRRAANSQRTRAAAWRDDQPTHR